MLAATIASIQIDASAACPANWKGAAEDDWESHLAFILHCGVDLTLVAAAVP
jgi:hypothetical protein